MTKKAKKQTESDSKKKSDFNSIGNSYNKRAISSIRAHVIEVKKQSTLDPTAEPRPSKSIEDDHLQSLIEQGKAISPPFDLLTLTMLPEHNSELGQSVASMVTNIESTGYRFPSIMKEKEESEIEESIKKQINAEQVRLKNFFKWCTEETFIEFREKQRTDIETTGNAYFEVLRDSKGNIQSFTHMPAYQMRIGRMEPEHTECNRKILELQEDGTIKTRSLKRLKRFRRYIQCRYASSVTAGNSVTSHRIRWFKEFGDPRTYDCENGTLIPESKLASFPEEKKATEIIHRSIYSARSAYGLPRFIGNLLSIFGDRAAEEINYVTLRNNNIPSMAVLVSNGQLTEGTIKRIEDFVESQIQGSDNYSKFLIVEAEGRGFEGEDGGQFKIDIKPLTDAQNRDSLFQNYSSNNQDKIRRAFRLPPIFVGRADDYTRTTAESSRRLADEQIFAPERDKFDELMNRIIFPEMGIIFHTFKSNSPNTTDNDKLVKILATSEKTGGMTPAIARSMLEEILGRDLGDFPVGFPKDMPFSLTMAEAVKNKAEPTEPGQQVTALKALGVLSDDEIIEDDDVVMLAAERLLKINKKLEQLWKSKTEE